MGSTQVNRINLKLYLEGIEIPCANAQIIESATASPKADIQIPVDDLALDIKSRTTVHLFYKDSSLPDWVLIFEGEVSATSISKNFDSRTVSLGCVSISNHWNYAEKSPNMLTNYTGEASARIQVTFGSGTPSEAVPSEVKSYRESLKLIAKDSGLPKPLKEDVETMSAYDKAIAAGTPEYEAAKAKNNTLSTDNADMTLNINNQDYAMYDFATLARKILESTNDSGNLASVISGLADDFARSNVGYTPFHIAYQMSRRVFGFKNSKIDSLTQSKEIQTLLRQKGENASGSSTLIQMIQDFLEVFNYKIISPSAPTYNELRGVPESFIALPTPTFFAPIACNTIFKDEVITASFSRDHLSEITRLGTHVYPSVNAENNPLKAFDEIMVAPTGILGYTPVINKEGKKSYIPELLLSAEERLRGINGATTFSDFVELKAVLDANNQMQDLSSDFPTSGPYTEAQEKILADRKRTLDGLVRDFRSRWVDAEYQKRILSSRSFAVTTNYSPYRICGLPGLYMDDVLPCVVGTVASVVSSLDPNGTAISQVTFSMPKHIRPEGKISPKDKDSLEAWLMLKGLSKEEVSNDDILKQEWPFLDEDWSGSQKQKDRWIQYLRGKINNPDELSFLKSWYDPNTYFPDQIGKKIYRQLMYGLAYDPNTAGIPDFKSSENNKRYKVTINEELDGGISKFKKSELFFSTGRQDATENTNLIAHHIRTLQSAYDNTSEERRKDFADKFKRRRLVTEKEFWKFLVGLPEDKDIRSIEALKLGIRDSQATVGKEAELVSALIKSNKAAVGVPASAPFIKSRRGVIKNMRDKLLRNGYFIGGKS